MGYNEEDEELDRIRRASARRKRELEELQREELRRIRELEQRKQEKKMREQRREERPRTRTFDPDQAVSDEDYNNSYEERRRRPRNPEPRYEEDEYDEDFEEADDRETRRERQQKQAKRNARRRKRKKSPAARFFKTFFIVLLVLFLIFFFAVWNITRRFNHVESEVSKRPAAGKHQVVNILLIGQDAREGEEGQRSDSIILLSVNAKKNKVAMTSIMRDTYVQIPGHGGNRINAAYAYGGIDLLDQTIEENFGITIDGNAMVDFDGFLEAMTAVGNMDMELTAEEAQYMNENPGFGSNNDASDEVWNLQPGVNNLTPSQLLAYSRIRYVGNSDWDRTERQRKVISGAVSKVKHGHFISGYNMATEAAPSITTDMKTFGMLRVASGIMTGGEMKSHLIPVEGTYYGDYIDGMAVLVPDIEANKNYLQGYINGED